MSGIQKRLNKILDTLRSNEGTPIIPIITLDTDGIYKMSDNGNDITFNTEQELKEYFNKRDTTTNHKKYIVIQIVRNNRDLERAFYNDYDK